MLRRPVLLTLAALLRAPRATCPTALASAVATAAAAAAAAVEEEGGEEEAEGCGDVCGIQSGSRHFRKSPLGALSG